MSASNRSRQISALAEKLVPLGGKVRGMQLGADDWNAIVGALSDMLQLARSQDEEASQQLELGFAKADHDHLGEVSLAWLEPALQGQFGESGGGSLAAQQVAADLKQAIASLQGEVARLTAQVAQQQAVIDHGAADGIDRGRRLSTFDARFAGLENLKTAVTSIGQSQQALTAHVADVIKLKQSLSDPAGNPIDFVGLAGRVTELQSIRDSLTGVDGHPLRLKDLQLQVIALKDDLSSAGADGFDTRIADLRSALTNSLSDDVKRHVADLRSEVATSRNDLATLVTTRLDAGLIASRADLLAAAASRIDAAEVKFAVGLAENLVSVRDAVTATVPATVTSALGSALASLDARIADAVTRREPAIVASLGGELRGQLDRDLTSGAAVVEARLNTRLALLETSVNVAVGGVSGLVGTSVAAATGQLQATLDARLEAQAQEIRQGLKQSVAETVQRGVDDVTGTLRQTALDAVSDGLRAGNQRIDAAIQQATSGLNVQVAQVIDERLTQTGFQTLITASNIELARQLRSEIATSAAKVLESSTISVRTLGTDLRSELARDNTVRLTNATVSDAHVFRRGPG